MKVMATSSKVSVHAGLWNVIIADIYLLLFFFTMHVSTKRDVLILADEKSQNLKVLCPLCKRVYREPYIASCGVRHMHGPVNLACTWKMHDNYFTAYILSRMCVWSIKW